MHLERNFVETSLGSFAPIALTPLLAIEGQYVRGDTSILVLKHKLRNGVNRPATNYICILIHASIAELEH